jgi:hypothetical protein
MIGKDGVPILQGMERLDCMPVIKMEEIKFPVFIEPVEIFDHPPAHTITILHNVVAAGLAVMVVNSFYRLVLDPATGKVVNLVGHRQRLSEMGRGTGKSAHALGIEGFPAENGYLK